MFEAIFTDIDKSELGKNSDLVIFLISYKTNFI